MKGDNALGRIRLISAALLAGGLFLALIAFPEECVSAAESGVESWLTVVVPSMLPFFIAANLLSETGCARILASVCEPVTRRLFRLPGSYAYALIAGALSGYPMGARIAADELQRRRIDETAATAIVNVTSVSGPLFIIGAVGVGMLGSGELAPYILLPHYASAIILALLGAPFRRRPEAPARRDSIYDVLYDSPFAKKSLGEAMAESVGSAIDGVLSIGGFIVLFSVIIEISEATGATRWPIEQIDALCVRAGMEPCGRPIISGLLELTNGCMAASASSVGLGVKLPLLTFIITFGGLSIHAQTRSFCAGAGLKLKGFFAAKLTQAIIAACLSAAAIAVAPPAVPVFLPAVTVGEYAFMYAIGGSIAAALAAAIAVGMNALTGGGGRRGGR